MIRYTLMFGVALILLFGTKLALDAKYAQGVSDTLAAQKAADAAAYSKILETINATTLDPSDDLAVMCELYRLANIEPEDIKCSGM